MSTYPVEFKRLEEENKELRRLLHSTKTFLLRLEAISICGKICCTKGHIFTMRKQIEKVIDTN
jgi:hypothetical protein